MNEACEVENPAFISCCEATEVLHSPEAALDAIAVFIGAFVMGNDDLTRAVRRDDGLGSHGSNDLSRCIAVVGLVGQHGITDLSLQKGRCLRDVANLTCRHDEP